MKYAFYQTIAVVTLALLFKPQVVASAVVAPVSPVNPLLNPITLVQPVKAPDLPTFDTIDLLPVPVASPAPAAAVSPVPTAAPVSGCGDNEYAHFIYIHESGCRTDALNSIGACGIGQALPCGTMGCLLSDYVCQNNYFTNYAFTRYGSWANAAAFWQAHSWW